MSIIKSKDQFLKWFDVSRYEKTRTFGIQEWNKALRRRSGFTSLLLRFKNTDSYIPREELNAGFLDLLANPTDTSRLGRTQYPRTVVDLSIMCAWDFRNAISDDDEATTACKAWELAQNTPGMDDDDIVYQDQPFHLANFNEKFARQCGDAFAAVNLSAPDSVILEDFRLWLKEIRKSEAHRHSPVRKFTPKELAHWSSYQVLAYLDLKIACKYFFDFNVPNHLAGTILFPAIVDIDLTERMRKVVCPLVEELQKGEFLDAIGLAANSDDLSQLGE